MKNWAGNLKFNPKTIYSPKSKTEIQECVRETISQKRTLRTRGSGHSWTGLIASDDNFLHLDNYQGVLNVDTAKKQITAKTGTKLVSFGHEGFISGLALPNQGDIDRQSLAGALSTGTHGTGRELQSMANQIKSVTFINGLGEEVTIDSNSPEIDGAKVSLGALGVATEMTIQMEESYRLRVEAFPESIERALEQFEERLKTNRHLEMFFFPLGDWTITKIMNKTHEAPIERGLIHRLNESVVENWLYTQMNRIAGVTGLYSGIDRIMQKCVSHTKLIDWSHRAFPTPRDFKFKEMEYAIPVHEFKNALREIQKKVKERGFKTLMPVEIRFVKRDSLWLSPCYERDCVYFAFHTYISEDHREYFKDMELIMRAYGGRPHWGKMHSLKAKDFSDLYPKFHDFLILREKFDPNGVFLNRHLLDIFM